jgi:hypothetical protein
MANQLELNEAEMQQYEEVINDLAEQLDCVKAERDEQRPAVAYVRAASDAQLEH